MLNQQRPNIMNISIWSNFITQDSMHCGQTGRMFDQIPCRARSSCLFLTRTLGAYGPLVIAPAVFLYLCLFVFVFLPFCLFTFLYFSFCLFVFCIFVCLSFVHIYYLIIFCFNLTIYNLPHILPCYLVNIVFCLNNTTTYNNFTMTTYGRVPANFFFFKLPHS